MLEGAERLTDDTSRPERATVTNAHPSPNTAPRFNAFLSYSRTPDESLARALQDGLHQFARPWNRVRALRVFRDKASLSASETLRGSLEDALADSDFLILLASPGAAQSLWVGREADWWCSHRKRAHFLIALTEGEIVWDSARGDFDWERTTALPPVLRGRFPEEPLHIDLRWARHSGDLSLRDLRFQDCVADLAAPLHGRPKDELIGDDIRQHKRFVRFRRAVFGAIGALVAGVGVAAYVAEQQRANALQQHGLALARQLVAAQARLRASHAGDAVSTELAAALAVESLRRLPNADASSAAVMLLRELPTARIPHDGEVNTIAFSPDGTLVASGSDDHAARVIDLAGNVVRRIDETGAVNSVAISPDNALLLTGSGDGQTRLVRIATGADAVPAVHDAAPVTAVAFSPDGALLASAAWDGTVHLRNTATGLDVVPPLHTARKACCVAFNADGTRLATGNAAGTRLIDTATGRDAVPPIAQAGAVTTLAFSPDGALLAIGSADRTARLVSTATGADAVAPVVHGGIVRRVAFSPDGLWWATASLDRRARLLDARTGGLVAEVVHEGGVRSVDFSADSKLLATGSLDDTARLIDVKAGREVARIAHGGVVMKVAFNPRPGVNLRLLATASGKGEALVRLVDTANGIDFRQLQPDKPVRSISISGDGGLMAIDSADDGACDGHGTAAANAGQVTIVRLSDGMAFPPILYRAPPCQAILSLDGRKLAAALADGTAEVMELPPQALMAAAPQGLTLGSGPVVQIRHQGPVTSVDFSPDGAWMASGGADRMARVVDARSGKDVISPIRLPAPVTTVRFSNDGHWLGVAASDGTVQLIALAGQAPPATFRSGGLINGLTFSHDSRLLATASADGTARIIDVASSREIVPVRGSGPALAVAFSPDGHLLATGGEDGTARLIDAATGEEMHRLSQGDQAVNNVFFSPDGQLVATVNDDDTARLFAVASGDEVSRFERDRPITTVAYTPDGRLLAVGDTQQVNLYWADPQHIIDSLCGRQGRNMSADEWSYYIGNGEPWRATCPLWRIAMNTPALTR